MEKKDRMELSFWARFVERTISVDFHRLRKLFKKRKTSKNAASLDVLDPYSYTSGRWLRRDKIGRDARRVVFDFDALCAVAVQLCSGATKVLRYEKHEGSFNRVFVLELDNETRIVTRIPTPIAGPPRLTTNSEVATTTSLKRHTSIPTPKILDWSDDKTNLIGTEYIIMEYIAGIRLCERWPTTDMSQHIKCVQGISQTMAGMAAITFPAYGSLYFATAPFDGKYRIDLGDGFCFGPNYGTRYWNSGGDVSNVSAEGDNKNRGPWLNLSSQCSSLIDVGLSKISRALPVGTEYPPYHRSIEEHIRLLGIGKDVIDKLIEHPSLQKAATPTLLHADPNKRNIIVSIDDPTVVTGITDWQ